MANLAKKIYDHYETYLGDMLGADFYPEKNLQLMGFQDAVEGCLTFGTMGLSLHKKELGCCCEAVLTAEEDLDVCAELFVKVLSYIIDRQLPLNKGMTIGGLAGLQPEFAFQHHKSAIYFTEPTMFTGAFREIDEQCRIYMAFFITPEEEEYIRKNGAEKFEKLLEQQKTDVISLDRDSVVPGGPAK